QYLPRQFHVNVGSNQVMKGKRNLLIFSVAVRGSAFWQVPLRDDARKQFSIGTIGEAEQVEVSLCRGAMKVGEGREGRRYLGVLYVPVVGVGCSRNQTTCLLLSKLQHYIRGKFVGGVLRIAQNRYFENVISSVTHLVRHDIEELPYYGVDRCDTLRGRILWHSLEDFVYILVADADLVLIVPGIGYALTISRL